MKRNRFVLIVVLLVLILVAGVYAADIPPIPCEFYGQVSINGQPAPAGVLIEAKINGQTAGSLTTTANGVYGGAGTFDARLVVNGQSNGDSITFFVNGVIANQTATFQERNTQLLDLTMFSGLKTEANATLTVTATQTIPVSSSGYSGGQGLTVAATPTTTSSLTPAPEITATLTAAPATSVPVQHVVAAQQVPTQESTQIPVNNPATTASTVPVPAVSKPTQSPGFSALFCFIGLVIVCGLKVVYR